MGAAPKTRLLSHVLRSPGWPLPTRRARSDPAILPPIREVHGKKGKECLPGAPNPPTHTESKRWCRMGCGPDAKLLLATLSCKTWRPVGEVRRGLWGQLLRQGGDSSSSPVGWPRGLISGRQRCWARPLWEGRAWRSQPKHAQGGTIWCGGCWRVLGGSPGQAHARLLDKAPKDGAAPGKGGPLGPGCPLASSSPLVLAAPALPSQRRPRPDTCSHTQPCQAWPCSPQTWPRLPTRRHTPSHTLTQGSGSAPTTLLCPLLG